MPNSKQSGARRKLSATELAAIVESGPGLNAVVDAGATFLYSQVVSLTSQKISDDLHVIFGMGGNVAVLRTGEGAVVVDTMTFVPQGSAILDMATELAGEEVVMVINSHYHSDHTHGNPLPLKLPCGQTSALK